MRVLFATHNFPRFVGDASGSFLLRLAEALAELGVEVRVIAPAAPGLAPRETMRGITVERFRYAPRRLETLAYTGNMASDVRGSVFAKLALAGFVTAEHRATRRTVRTFAPDVVHAHWWFPSGVAASWPRGTGAPLVTSLHGTDVMLARRTRAAQPTFRRVMRRSSAVTAVSSFLAAEAESIAPGTGVERCAMPVATELFSPGEAREARDARLLFVGRLNAQKGIVDAIHALARMQVPASLDVVGAGEQEPEARALATSLRVADRVRWHGALPQGSLLPLYRRAAALVMPSLEEGLGLVAVEALLCETPVATYRSGGVVDVVRDGETGRVVEPSDTAALAAALDDLVGSPSRSAELGRAGRALALRTFAPSVAAARHLEIYERVLEAHARGTHA